MKFILVTGGVISGIGKGVIASSLGTILKQNGVRVTAIKIDPYINIDAGTFSPYEHGETYVLDDGAEVDLDLGNYERFLDVTLHRDNNITTGKIYMHVIEKERKGDFLGKTVQVVPHVTDAIQSWVERVAHCPVDGSNRTPEVCIIELGGTIGDIEGMAFVEAFRQFQFRVMRENFCCVYVSLVPQPSATGEHKTKPTQAGVRELRGLGLMPDFIMCRSEKPFDEAVQKKIANFCNVEPQQVIRLHDARSIYEVPLMMEEQKMSHLLDARLQLGLRHAPRNYMRKWRLLVTKQDYLRHEVRIALVGKYIQLSDAYASVIKALEHASLACNRRLKLVCVDAGDLEEEAMNNRPVKYYEAWRNVCESNGLLVPGGFGKRGLEGKMNVCRWARLNKKPFLGICLGLQVAVIEFARNVLGWKDAISQEMTSEDEELEKTKRRHVVVEMLEHCPGQMGGTMRLGSKKTLFVTEDSKVRQLYYGEPFVRERHRHRYEVNPEYVKDFEAAGLHFVGQDEKHERMEILELKEHPYYVATQYHPEYLSRPLNPSPPFLGLILASSGKLDSYLTQLVTQMASSSDSSSESSSSDDEEAVSRKLVARDRALAEISKNNDDTAFKCCNKNGRYSSKSTPIRPVTAVVNGANSSSNDSNKDASLGKAVTFREEDTSVQTNSYSESGAVGNSVEVSVDRSAEQCKSKSVVARSGLTSDSNGGYTFSDGSEPDLVR